MKRPVPSIGRLRALVRFFKDGNASILGKLFVLAAAFYVVWPADLIPDVPVIGWLDDIGVMGLATAYLTRVIAKYRVQNAHGTPTEPGETPVLET
jgi:uncharacterized membrane protein YkvA (DUF1232 family)